MKVLVTGGSGNIGLYVLHRLRSHHDLTVIDRNPPAGFPDLGFVDVDLMDAPRVRQTVRGFDAVVHLAAIPNPFADPADRVFAVNTSATFNLLEAIRENHIRRVVYCGSESESGFGIHNVEYRPLYFPVDEEHPCWPHESYSLSKYLSEILCREYSRAYRIQCVALRYACVWLDVIRDTIDEIVQGDVLDTDPKNWFGAYIFPEDVAQAVELALDYRLPDETFPFDIFYLTAADTNVKADSVSFIRKLFPDDPPCIKKPEYFEVNPHASLFDTTKARELLGFRPEFTWRDVDSPRRVRISG